MDEQTIRQRISTQRDFFATGATLPLSFRLKQLEQLKLALKRHEQDLYTALKADLGKSRMESYMCEIGLTLSELTWMQRHLPKLMRCKTVPTPLAHFAAKSFQSPSPYGTVLIMSPWNYPVLLTLEPLIDALAAGNTVILKPSAYAPHTSQILSQILKECYPPKYATMITGGREENQALLNQRFDKIFFTGGKTVGKEVLRHAAEYLTPVTLELGGKSPCIVDSTAKISLTARRIVFGKYLNCGQTCVAPDYVYCDEKRKEALICELKRQITKQFGSEPLKNPSYGKIINQKHFERIRRLLNPEKVIFGGNVNPDTLQIAPTLLDHVTFEDAIMQEEIFGPLLPVITYRTLDEAITRINSMECPLALYLFSKKKENIEKVTAKCQFGGGCVNDTIIHLATPYMGFGGCGESGMGSYHGKDGFETFSHTKSIVDKKTWIDLPVRYQPYRPVKKWLLKKVLG